MKFKKKIERETQMKHTRENVLLQLEAYVCLENERDLQGIYVEQKLK